MSLRIEDIAGNTTPQGRDSFQLLFEGLTSSAITLTTLIIGSTLAEIYYRRLTITVVLSGFFLEVLNRPDSAMLFNFLLTPARLTGLMAEISWRSTIGYVSPLTHIIGYTWDSEATTKGEATDSSMLKTFEQFSRIVFFSRTASYSSEVRHCFLCNLCYSLTASVRGYACKGSTKDVLLLQ